MASLHHTKYRWSTMAFYKPKILSPVKKHPEDTSRNVFTYVHHTTVAPETTIPIKRQALEA
jgi:hypothetical protein